MYLLIIASDLTLWVLKCPKHQFQNYELRLLFDFLECQFFFWSIHKETFQGYRVLSNSWPQTSFCLQFYYLLNIVWLPLPCQILSSQKQKSETANTMVGKNINTTMRWFRAVCNTSGFGERVETFFSPKMWQHTGRPTTGYCTESIGLNSWTPHLDFTV